ncbi:MAG: TraR/DksA C4-type zinc finger protein [Dehalococcoidales bacterium]|nr:TraR/DksA C4-type zinc finger protein [Dehalococcoidales bacterium]
MTTSSNLLRSHLEMEQRRLAEQLKQIESSIRSTEERRVGSPFGKREEEATETLELEKQIALEKRLRAELAEIEWALRKFETGTFGLCEKCGQAIDPARLEALPQARLCMKCKAQQEKDARIKLSPG